MKNSGKIPKNKYLLVFLIVGIVCLDCSSVCIAKKDVQAANKINLLLLDGYLDVAMRYGLEIKSGETWFGLYRRANGFELKKVIVKIEKTDLKEGDEEGDCGLGSYVTVPEDPEPIFLVNGINGLKEGSVETSIDGGENGEYLTIGKTNVLTLGEFRYSIRVLGKVTSSETTNETLVKEASIELSNPYNNRSRATYREIARIEQYYPEPGYGPEIYWAGDIDRDGRLDIMMSLYDDECTKYFVLFLSSITKDGTPLKQAAMFIPGCC